MLGRVDEQEVMVSILGSRQGLRKLMVMTRRKAKTGLMVKSNYRKKAFTVDDSR